MELEITEIQKAAQILAPRFGLILVVLFGSRATGHTHAKSDMDIAILSSRLLSPSDIAACAYEFSVILKQSDVEVADVRLATPLLLNAVARGTVLFERDDHVFTRFQMYAFKRFVEEKPLRDLRRASLKQFAASSV